MSPSQEKGDSLNIQNLFDAVTSRYDFMNDVMSFGLHRYWKKAFIDLIPQTPKLTLLDIASGTGDIAFGFLKKSQDLNSKVTLFDLSEKMIHYSKDRAINENIKGDLTWELGQAESLPFPDNSFDVCTVSFGLRNFKDRERSLSEIYRVLKPKGTFLCLEFSQPQGEISTLYDLYLSSVIPKMGKVFSKNEGAYTYLAESIQKFPGAEELKFMIEREGFKSASYIRLNKGIVAIHRGWK
ncbi:bifunctional demethylmenaquinone methyltransferase/2-methoxy-6-polyprenyl-1,4-benzoquinol methylase UbiE [Alphaproteobacteria bacterium]|nr:bifunctional demethylmenaquinone methyltransferase/2-methoxy-6-polyprenyl-1,4-benzoquinol methylase UbiE [Alphaproteobacteria bacterium]